MEIDISGAVQGFVQDVEKQVASRAERAAHVIRKYELSVLSNNPKRSGKVYRKPASNKTYTASAPVNRPPFAPATSAGASDRLQRAKSSRAPSITRLASAQM